MPNRLPTFADIERAAERLRPYAVRTPLIEHPELNAHVGGRILLKAENLQRVGAFKFRGAYNMVSQVDKAAYPGGVVACSSGNHAQGVAAAAALVGLKSAIVMPHDAPALKMARTKAYGGEVIGYDRETEDREEIARRLCKERKAALVHPFDDPDVIAGQGTAGLELCRQAAEREADLDAVLVCCAGGDLSSGVALAVKALSPQARVMTVEPEGFDDFARSLATGERQRNPRMAGSICDALLVPTPGELTFALAQQHIAGGLTVSDDEVREAMRYAFLNLKLVIEPGGAVALAAVLSGKLPVEGRTIGVVISGGNVDPAAFAEIITAKPAI